MIRTATAALLLLAILAATPAATAQAPTGLPDLSGPDVPVRDALGTTYGLVTSTLDELTDTGSSTTMEVDDQADSIHAAADAASQQAQQQVADAQAAVEQALHDQSSSLMRAAAEARQTAWKHVEEVQMEATMLVPDEEPESGPEPVETQGQAVVEEGPTHLIVGTAMVAASGLAVAWLIKSGVVGAGATLSSTSAASGAGHAATRAGDLRRIPGLAAPLFTRFNHETVLAHDRRRELYELVASTPGICLPELCEATGLSRTAATHHLRLLEKQHIIVSERHGRSRHFFQNGGRYANHQKEAYAVLQNDRSHALAHCVAKTPGVIQKELCDALGLDASVAHWHLRRLQEAGLVDGVRQGRTVAYFPLPPLREIQQAAAYT